MNPGLLKSFIWWLCEKADHPFPNSDLGAFGDPDCMDAELVALVNELRR